MKVTAHISSYASGGYQFCEHFDSMAKAVKYFRDAVNGEFAPMYLDGIGVEGKPDATVAVYQYTPEDNDVMAHNDYPLALFSVGQRRYGEYTIRRESI